MPARLSMPDLFWGLRGGGGNFGVVTSFEYQLHPVGPTVLAGTLFYPMAAAPEVLRFYREFAATAPEALGSLALLRIAPTLPSVPAHVQGKPVITLSVCYAGSLEDSACAIQALKQFGTPLADSIGPQPYAAFQSMFDAGVPPGRHYYWKSEYLPALSDEALDTVAAYSERVTSPHTSVILFQLGGAVARGSDSAAYHRDAGFAFNIASGWLDPQESDRHLQWTRSFWSAMRRFSIGGAYVNFLSEDDGADRVKAAYGANYERLVALKNRYDPANLFRMNQNISPSA